MRWRLSADFTRLGVLRALTAQSAYAASPYAHSGSVNVLGHNLVVLLGWYTNQRFTRLETAIVRIRQIRLNTAERAVARLTGNRVRQLATIRIRRHGQRNTHRRTFVDARRLVARRRTTSLSEYCRRQERRDARQKNQRPAQKAGNR